ncbi:hypothetical protein GCM10022221_07260 [Actinocorallia aurea]
MTTLRDDEALGQLREEYPGWWFFRSRTRDGRVGSDWVATRCDRRPGFDPTVIRRAPGELREALDEQIRRARGPVAPDVAEVAMLDLAGWDVALEGGLLLAGSRRTFTLYQRMAGVQDHAEARTVEELHVLCHAYDALAEGLVRAEAVRRAWFEAGRP